MVKKSTISDCYPDCQTFYKELDIERSRLAIEEPSMTLLEADPPEKTTASFWMKAQAKGPLNPGANNKTLRAKSTRFQSAFGGTKLIAETNMGAITKLYQGELDGSTTSMSIRTKVAGIPTNAHLKHFTIRSIKEEIQSHEATPIMTRLLYQKLTGFPAQLQSSRNQMRSQSG